MASQIFGLLIVAQPGRMLASFRVLFKSLLPGVSIEQFEEVFSAMQRLAGSQPLLVLIDASLPGDAAWSLGEVVRQAFPQHHAAILAHNIRQGEQASAAGLVALLLEGMTAARLSAALDVFRLDFY